MSVNPLTYSLRARKLGVLIYDARTSERRSIPECAQAIGVSDEIYQSFENGSRAPTLPEVEVLAYYLNINLDHFWGRYSITENKKEDQLTHIPRLIQLRQRMIGALVRQVRTTANLSAKEIAERTGISETDLRSFELGERGIPLPELEVLASTTGSHIEFFMDERGPVGAWRNQQQAIQKFLELSTDMQDFVCKPVNRPYVELALRLSELSVEKLRAVAEGLLEITY
jgi:transcriptional regulator with XRE-family HTH domain